MWCRVGTVASIHRFVGRETLLRLIRDYPRVAATILEVMAVDGVERAG